MRRSFGMKRGVFGDRANAARISSCVSTRGDPIMTIRFGILIFPNVQQLDLTGPYEVFATAKDAEVHLIWKDRKPVRASTGLMLTPTASFDACPPLDVICIPGGGGVNPLLDDATVLDFVRSKAADALYVTSVCSGAIVLGAAGLLEG